MSTLNSRVVLGAGGVAVFFALAPDALAQPSTPEDEVCGGPIVAPDLPGSLSRYLSLDSWIHIASGGDLTVFTGKAELGQAAQTALWQLAVEKLDADSTSSQ